MWSNISGLHIADQKVKMLVFDQLSVELDQFLKFEGGTDNHRKCYLSKFSKFLTFCISLNNRKYVFQVLVFATFVPQFNQHVQVTKDLYQHQ